MQQWRGTGLADTWGTPPGPWNPPPEDGNDTVRVWAWSAVNAAGKPKRGQMEAADRDVVGARLRALGLSSIRVQRAFPSLSLDRLRWWVTARDRLILSVQLRTMRDAGLPLDVCLSVLAKQSPRAVGRRLRAVRLALEAGVAPADAIAASGGLLAAAD